MANAMMDFYNQQMMEDLRKRINLKPPLGASPAQPTVTAPPPPMTPTGLPSLTPPAQPGPFGMPKEKWGQLSNILGGAARAFGQSDYNPRTGERSTWGSRLGGEMQDVRQQEIENRSRNIEDIYRKIQMDKTYRELEQQIQQETAFNTFIGNKDVMDKLQKRFDLTPEATLSLVKSWNDPGKIIESLGKGWENIPLPEEWRKTKTPFLPENSTLGTLSHVPASLIPEETTAYKKGHYESFADAQGKNWKVPYAGQDEGGNDIWDWSRKQPAPVSPIANIVLPGVTDLEGNPVVIPNRGTPTVTPVTGEVIKQKLSSEMVVTEQQIGTLRDTFNRAKTLYKKDYVGPISGRVASMKEKTVGIPNEQAAFNSGIAQMQNSLVYLMSGKQINEQEYERLKRQLPSIELPSNVFEARMDEFERTLNSIITNREKNINVGTPQTTENATSFSLNGKTYDIPKDKIDEFKKQNPSAKRIIE